MVGGLISLPYLLGFKTTKHRLTPPICNSLKVGPPCESDTNCSKIRDVVQDVGIMT